MTFFTGLGIFIVALFYYLFLYGVCWFVLLHELDDGKYVVAAVIVGIVLSLELATFICSPESYGYKKITVSENVVEVSE